MKESLRAGQNQCHKSVAGLFFCGSFLDMTCNQMAVMDVVNLYRLSMFFTTVIPLDGLFCPYQVVRFLIILCDNISKQGRVDDIYCNNIKVLKIFKLRCQFKGLSLKILNGLRH